MADLIAKYGSKWGANDLFIEGMKRGVEEAVEATRVAHMAGVPIAAASDNFADLNGYEAMVPRWLVEAGLKPYEALKSATIINARLFKMEHKIGSVEIGKWADLIVCAGRPDENADVLADPANIRLVMKEGDIVKFTL
ncbi:MAG: amidohydrolase family protein [Desulfobacteraceae bacterium]|nr:amidohydrolase family protein [Desulfobacteraceae bacterium]